MAKKSEKPEELDREKIRRLPQYSKMKSALSPLIENLKDESSAPYLFVKKNCEALDTSIVRVIEVEHLNDELLDTISLILTTKPKIRSLLFLYHYLAVVESAATNFIDTALLLLIAAGHDLHIERRFVRHVSCFEDLTKVDLWTKLESLKEHNLKPFCKIFDRKLRNRIAHLDFTIDSDGTIKTRKGVKIDIFKKIHFIA